MARIVVADDEATALEMTKRVLESVGHEVLGTVDSREALALVEAGGVDAMVLDVVMPHLTGLDVLARVRGNPATRALPVVLVSARGAVSDRVRGIRAGADDYIVKPFAPEELVVRVDSLLARRTADPSAQEGQLDDQPLHELLQNLEQNQKTGLLEVFAPDGSGRIEVWKGRLLRPRFSRLSGVDAVLAMLELPTGRFRFRVATDAETPSGDAVAPGPTLAVQPLLMEAAWLEDELSSRAKHLPGTNQPVELTTDTVDVPEDLAELPVGAVLDRLQSGGATTLEALLEEQIAAPRRVRLALAWLLEQAGRSCGSVNAPAQATLDSAIARFVEAAGARGLAVNELEVIVFVHPRGWLSLVPLLLDIPEHAIRREQVKPQSGRRRHRGILDSGDVLRLMHSAGTILLRIKRFRSPADPLPALDPSAAVVLWLGADLSDAELESLAARLEDASGSAAACLLIAASGRAPGPDFTGARARWRVSTKFPRSIAELLLGLTGRKMLSAGAP